MRPDLPLAAGRHNDGWGAVPRRRAAVEGDGVEGRAAPSQGCGLGGQPSLTIEVG
jgi:hypothetical protein